MRQTFLPPSNCVASSPRPSFSPSCVTIHVTILSLPEELRRCPYCFAGSTFPMPTIASNGRAVSGTFAIIAAILAALWHRALAARMHTFVGFLSAMQALLHPPCGKKIPLRSWPISAKELVDVLSGSETNWKSSVWADHSIIALFSMNSPAKPFTTSRVLTRLVTPLQRR